MIADPFGTAAVRDQVLAAWGAAPVRFREDANAEEELVLGGYRDRLIVELAQNAADAATRAGIAGRLRLRLDEVAGRPTLRAENTGTPLDAEGVHGLCTLRASAKRGEHSVGRFGVGFAAVLAITDEPVMISRTGGVAFSAARTRQLVQRTAEEGAPGLAAELERRAGHVPVLRLPFAAAPPGSPPEGYDTGCPGSPPEGYDTAVLLPLRDDAARAAVLRLLDEVDDALLLALPALAEIEIRVAGRPPRVLGAVEQRWHVLRRAGRHPPELLSDRPTEERARPGWTVTWAVPRDGAAGSAPEPAPGPIPVPATLHAPTPSDEPLAWPALLVASFPLDVTRRHVAPGAATDGLVRIAAEAYVELLVERAGAGQDVLSLIPDGLPLGSLDGALREALDRLLPGARVLRSAEDPELLLRPRDAVMVEGPAGSDPEAVAVLARHVAGLVAAPRRARAVLGRLGVGALPLSEVLASLALPAADGEGWRRLYGGLTRVADDPQVREELAAVPVPLADGRVVRGPRGCLLAERLDAGTGRSMTALGVRVVHPDAAVPLLERLGAVRTGIRAVLDQPAVRAAVAASLDGAGIDGVEVEEAGGGRPPVTDAVLGLVAAGLEAGELSAGTVSGGGDLAWLGDLALPDAAGELDAASGLVMPGSNAAEIFDRRDVAEVSPALVERWGREVLAAVGVMSEPVVARIPVAGEVFPGPVVTGAGAVPLDGWDDWLEDLSAGPDGPAEPVGPELLAVRDLDAVRDDAWGRLLRWVAGNPVAREAVVRPVRLVSPSGRSEDTAGSRIEVPGYTAWWLRRNVIGGAVADPGATAPIRALLPPAPAVMAGLDPELRAALGAVTAIADLGPDTVADVLERMGDPAVELDAVTTLGLWRRLAVLAASAGSAVEGWEPPERVRVLDGGRTRVVGGQEPVVVVDSPAWLQRDDLGGMVVVEPRLAASLAELLDLPLATEEVPGRVAEEGPAAGRGAEVPEAVRTVLPGAPSRWCEHDDLRVDGVEVDWWVAPGRAVHAATLDGLARAVSWAAGAWGMRDAVGTVLADPAALPSVVVDLAFDARQGAQDVTGDRTG